MRVTVAGVEVEGVEGVESSTLRVPHWDMTDCKQSGVIRVEHALSASRMSVLSAS